MARINIASDLGSPLVVTAADLITQKVKPDWNEWVMYILTGLGYIGGAMGFGGDFVKNLGVASLPMTARHIAGRAGFTPGVARGVSRSIVRTVSRYPGSTTPSEFAGARLD